MPTSILSFRLDDRYLWLGLGVLAVGAAHGIRYALRDLVRLTAIDPNKYNHNSGTQERPEDALSLDTLRILASSPNPSIAASAISLIVAPILRGGDEYKLIAKDLSSTNETLRAQARMAFRFVNEHPLPLSVYDYSSRNQSEAGLVVLNPPVSENVSDDGGNDDSTWNVHFSGDLNPLARGNDRWNGGDTNVARVQRHVNPQHVPRERPSTTDGDEAETERRRWRREAMVFLEGEGRIGEENIFRARVDR